MFDRKWLIRFASVSAFICLFPLCSGAQHFFSNRLTGGLVNYPMHDFKARYSAPFDVKITKDASNLCAGLSVFRRLTWESYVFSEIEYLQTSISYDSLALWNYPSGVYDFSRYHWQMQLYSIPLSMGYEKRNPLNRSGIIPFYQVGGTLLYSTVESRRWSDSLDLVQETKRCFGYGFFGAFGLSYPFSKRLAGVVKARARYADGMHFSGDPAGFRAEFSSFDLSAGMEYGY